MFRVADQAWRPFAAVGVPPGSTEGGLMVFDAQSRAHQDLSHWRRLLWENPDFSAAAGPSTMLTITTPTPNDVVVLRISRFSTRPTHIEVGHQPLCCEPVIVSCNPCCVP